MLSREQLLDEARGRNIEAFDRSIDLLVSRLRHKLAEDPKDPKLIRTLRGEGYILPHGEPMNRRIRALIEGLLPHRFVRPPVRPIGHRHCVQPPLFGLQVNLREGHNRPLERRGAARADAPKPKRTFLRPICRAPHPKNLCPPGAPAHARVLWPRLFGLGLVGQCLLVLLIARWGSRMLTRPIEQLAAVRGP